MESIKYPIDVSSFSKLPQSKAIKQGKQGNLLTRIPYSDTWVDYPVNTCLYMLGCYEKAGGTKLHEFFKQFTFLLFRGDDDKGAYFWHNFTLPFYHFPYVPWMHGMAQGLMLSILVRVYHHTDDEGYLVMGKLFQFAFKTSVSEGGVRFIDDKSDVWFEEYGIPDAPHVLNGFIFALFGLYEFYMVTGDEEAFELFSEGCDTLKKNIYRFDTGFWSRYDLNPGKLASRTYHNLNWRLVAGLGRVLEDEMLLGVAARWCEYERRIWCQMRGKVVRLWQLFRLLGVRKMMLRARWRLWARVSR